MSNVQILFYELALDTNESSFYIKLHDEAELSRFIVVFHNPSIFASYYVAVIDVDSGISYDAFCAKDRDTVKIEIPEKHIMVQIAVGAETYSVSVEN